MYFDWKVHAGGGLYGAQHVSWLVVCAWAGVCEWTVKSLSIRSAAATAAAGLIRRIGLAELVVMHESQNRRRREWAWLMIIFIHRIHGRKRIEKQYLNAKWRIRNKYRYRSIDIVKVLRPTRHRMCHFGDLFPANLFYYSYLIFLFFLLTSGPWNSFNCLGHYKQVYDDGDDNI